MSATEQQIFVAPDNGLLTYVIRDFEIKSAYQITNQSLFTKPINNLFATQILGTAGARIASGYAPEDIGPAADDPYTFDVQEAVIVENKIVCEVVLIDHFGNCVTNIPRNVTEEFGLKLGDDLIIITPDAKITAMFGTTYGDVLKNNPVIFVDSRDLIELAINMGSFAETYNINTGTTIEIEKRGAETVTFVFDRDFPPLTFMENDTAQGFELDLLSGIGKEEGFVE